MTVSFGAPIVIQVSATSSDVGVAADHANNVDEAAQERLRVRDRLRRSMGLLHEAAQRLPIDAAAIVLAADHLTWTLRCFGIDVGLLTRYDTVGVLCTCLRVCTSSIEAAHAVLKPLYDVLLLTVPPEYFSNPACRYAVPHCADIILASVSIITNLHTTTSENTVLLRAMCVLALLSFNVRATVVFAHDDGAVLKAVISATFEAGCDASATITTGYLHWLSSMTSHADCQAVLFRHDAFFMLPDARRWLANDGVDPSLRLYMAKTLAKIASGLIDFAEDAHHRVLANDRHEFMSTLSVAAHVVATLQATDVLDRTEEGEAKDVAQELLACIRRLVKYECHYTVLRGDADLQRLVVSYVAIREKNACELLLRLSSGRQLRSHDLESYALRCTLAGLARPAGFGLETTTATATATVTAALCVVLQHLLFDTTPYAVLQDAALAVAAAVSMCATSVDGTWTRVATGLVLQVATTVLRLLGSRRVDDGACTSAAVSAVLVAVGTDACRVSIRAVSDMRLLQTCYAAFLETWACFPEHHGGVVVMDGMIGSVCAALRTHAYSGDFYTTCCAVLSAFLTTCRLSHDDCEDVYDTVTALKAAAPRRDDGLCGALASVLLALPS